MARNSIPAFSNNSNKRLRPLFRLNQVLFALLAANALYLVAITLAEWLTGRMYQNFVYQMHFLLHLILACILITPLLLFGSAHIYQAWRHLNRRARLSGIGLLIASLLLLISGIILLRWPGFELKDPVLRAGIYWAHILTPVVTLLLFLLHRLSVRVWRWSAVGGWAMFIAAIAGVFLGTHGYSSWTAATPDSRSYPPSLARSVSHTAEPATVMMMDEYCATCHEDTHQQWSVSMHRFSSFNNPPYLASVQETRNMMLKRDGDVLGSRFCAGCHDPVPLFDGAFDKPDFDAASEPTANAGITCTVCHGITQINSNKGNADYTWTAPVHYPFATSDTPALRWLSGLLLKSKPSFHKKTFLKPLHQTAEFCGTCHKVHLPQAVNHYRWLRGQNHFDSFLLSGVSGHGISSFYYPAKASPNCNTCHMPLSQSDDFGAGWFDNAEVLSIHNHQFPAANTGVPHILNMPESVIAAQQKFLTDTLRVDIFALRAEPALEAPVMAPLRPDIPALKPGHTYLLDVVIRTLKLGHVFTQGTADSNEIWLDVQVRSGDKIIGRSGGLSAPEQQVDPWSHFVNAYVLDRDGNRITRRNAQDIFVALYNHQIAPGSADVVHYRMALPDGLTEAVTVDVKLQYRKFTNEFMQFMQGEDFVSNELPITTIASDSITFPLSEGPSMPPSKPVLTPVWERWNDYGIGLLNKQGTGELRQAEQAFGAVEQWRPGEGALNLARVYLKEGRLSDASQALARAQPHAAPWSLAWFGGLLDKQYGRMDQAIAKFKAIVASDFPAAQERGFDFSVDYRVLNELGQTLLERAKQERGADRAQRQREWLTQAIGWFENVLAIDPENATAFYNLALIYRQLGDSEKAAEQLALHERYKTDDNARERAVTLHRRANPAADHAAEAIVFYDLQRPGAFELP